MAPKRNNTRPAGRPEKGSGAIVRARTTRRNLRSAGFRLAADDSGRTAIQAELDGIAKEMVKDWLPRRLDRNDRLRVNRLPRGIENPGSHCYINAVLQTFMHMPIFLNWIRTHTADGRCGETCLKCNMKGLVEDYWGPTPPTQPIRMTNNHLVGIKAAAWANTYFEENIQEDANSVYDMFLFDDTHGLAAGESRWRKQFDALFKSEIIPFDTCFECGTERKKTSLASTGLEIIITPLHPPLAMFDSLADAIHHTLSLDKVGESECETQSCQRLQRNKYAGKHGPPQSRRWVLRTAPRVLKIRLHLARHVDGQVPIKFRGTLAIDERLDLSQYQEHSSEKFPLTYQLSSLVSHRGAELVGGHIITSVRTAGDRHFNINDSHWVEPLTQQEFTANPQTNRRTEGGSFEVYTLTYIMDEHTPAVERPMKRMLKELL